MKEFVVVRTSNNFDDILKDPNLKKKITAIMQFTNTLIIQLNDDDSVVSYMLLKYGDDMIDMESLVPSRTPVPGKDYTVQRKDVKVRATVKVN